MEEICLRGYSVIKKVQWEDKNIIRYYKKEGFPDSWPFKHFLFALKFYSFDICGNKNT